MWVEIWRNVWTFFSCQKIISLKRKLKSNESLWTVAPLQPFSCSSHSNRSSSQWCYFGRLTASERSFTIIIFQSWLLAYWCLVEDHWRTWCQKNLRRLEQFTASVEITKMQGNLKILFQVPAVLLQFTCIPFAQYTVSRLHFSWKGVLFENR